MPKYKILKIPFFYFKIKQAYVLMNIDGRQVILQYYFALRVIYFSP